MTNERDGSFRRLFDRFRDWLIENVGQSGANERDGTNLIINMGKLKPELKYEIAKNLRDAGEDEELVKFMVKWFHSLPEGSQKRFLDKHKSEI